MFWQQYVWWFSIALVLFLCELIGLAFCGIILALAAAITGFFALFLPHHLVANLVIFIISSTLLSIFVRPILLNFFLRNTPQVEHFLQSSIESIIGCEAEVLAQVDVTGGLVRCNGDTWSAKLVYDAENLVVGQKAIVLSVQGNTLLVSSSESLL